VVDPIVYIALERGTQKEYESGVVSAVASFLGNPKFRSRDRSLNNFKTSG